MAEFSLGTMDVTIGEATYTLVASPRAVLELCNRLGNPLAAIAQARLGHLGVIATIIACGAKLSKSQEEALLPEIMQAGLVTVGKEASDFVAMVIRGGHAARPDVPGALAEAATEGNA